MPKLIQTSEEVTACQECRYIRHMGSHFLPRCSETPQKIEIADASAIPDWCPLPDAPIALEADPTYPCRECGLPRTKAEGGKTFTVCDACWDKSKTAPVERRCGTCRWWKSWGFQPYKTNRLLGDCHADIPAWAAAKYNGANQAVVDSDGAECPTWAAKEELCTKP